MPDHAPLTLPPVPEAFLQTLAGIARRRFGKAAPEGRVLAAAVQDVSRRYTRDRARLMDSQGEPASLTARLRFYLPRDLYKVWGPLSELQLAGKLPQKRRLRVLDVGAGLGTTSLGLAAFAAEHGLCDALEIVAIDSDPQALSLLSTLLHDPAGLRCVPMKVQTETRRLSPEARLPGGPFDLILCGLALNEIVLDLPEGEQVEAGLGFLQHLAGRLADAGSLIVLEPALREESRRLHAVRDALQATPEGPHVFAPCLGIEHCPMLARPRDWCHERLPATLGGELGQLSRDAGLRDEALTYSYLTLRKARGNLADLAHDGEAYRVVGGPVGSKGKTEWSLCGTQRARQLLRLDRHRSAAPDALDDARRGTLLALGGPGVDTPKASVRATPELHAEALVRWVRTKGADTFGDD